MDKLFKTKIIKGEFAHFHHISMEDASLIYKLRSRKKNNYLHETSGNIEDQKKYLKSYFKRFEKREEIYFKVFDVKKSNFMGVLRLTELNSESVFNWESAVFDEESSPNLFIDSMLMIYRIGFEYLKKNQCGPWKVKKDFDNMMKIHKIIKMAKSLSSDEKYFHVAVKKKDYFDNIDRFLKIKFARINGIF